MSDALLLGVLALVATVAAGYPAINVLRRFNVGKEISEWGPESHQAKAGTPTMGGLLVFAVIAAVTLLFNMYDRYSIAAPLGTLSRFDLVSRREPRVSEPLHQWLHDVVAHAQCPAANRQLP